MKALPSYWGGTLFRSRTEARWACFFDEMGLRWEYEPQGFELSDGTRYLPDFWMPDMGMWVEVKPDAGPTRKERIKGELLAEGSGHPVLFLAGAPWPRSFDVVHPSRTDGQPGVDWWWACWQAQYTGWIDEDGQPHEPRDVRPRLFMCPSPGDEGCDIAELAMRKARAVDFSDPPAEAFAPLAWEGVGVTVGEEWETGASRDRGVDEDEREESGDAA
jgi:hypothetical protein